MRRFFRKNPDTPQAAYDQTMPNSPLSANVTNRLFKSLGPVYNQTWIQPRCSGATLGLGSDPAAYGLVATNHGPEEIRVEGDAEAARNYLKQYALVTLSGEASCHVKIGSRDPKTGNVMSSELYLQAERYQALNLQLSQDPNGTVCVSGNVNYGEKLGLNANPNCVVFKDTNTSQHLVYRGNALETGHFVSFLDSSRCVESPPYIQVDSEITNLATGNISSGGSLLFFGAHDATHDAEYARSMYGFSALIMALMILFACNRKRVIASILFDGASEEAAFVRELNARSDTLEAQIHQLRRDIFLLEQRAASETPEQREISLVEVEPQILQLVSRIKWLTHIRAKFLADLHDVRTGARQERMQQQEAMSKRVFCLFLSVFVITVATMLLTNSATSTRLKLQF